MTAPLDVLVTPEQFEQIESAWRICAGGKRGNRISGEWAQRFRQLVTGILGFEPPEQYALAKFGGGQ